jgi:hypothetical protein
VGLISEIKNFARLGEEVTKFSPAPRPPAIYPSWRGGPPPVRNALGAYVVLMFAMIRRSLNGELALTRRSIVS